jgi:hypothetical protein
LFLDFMALHKRLSRFQSSRTDADLGQIALNPPEAVV